MARTRLNDQQMAFFEAFGFLRFPALLADCIDGIIDEFEAVWERHGGGHDGTPHDGKRRSCLVPFIDQSERLSALLDDPRIHDIAASILGDDFDYSGSDGNYYAGDTGWHSDGWYVNRPPSIKIALYLDPVHGRHRSAARHSRQPPAGRHLCRLPAGADQRERLAVGRRRA